MAELNLQNNTREEVQREQPKETPDVSKVVIVYEEENGKPYKLINTEVFFGADIGADGSLSFSGGKLKTDFLIPNTEIACLETWRYIIQGIRLTHMEIDAAQDKITYDFTAESFSDQTFETEES